MRKVNVIKRCGCCVCGATEGLGDSALRDFAPTNTAALTAAPMLFSENVCERVCPVGVGGSTSANSQPTNVAAFTNAAPFTPPTGTPSLSAVLDFRTATVRSVGGVDPSLHNIDHSDTENADASRGAFVWDFESGVVRGVAHDALPECPNVQRRGVATCSSDATTAASNTFPVRGIDAGAPYAPVRGGIPVTGGPPHEYIRFGPCNRVCRHSLLY